MKYKALLLSAISLFVAVSAAYAAQPSEARFRIHNEGEHATIPAEIYGHFAEHLGTCIYGGLWVGPESEIANEEGYRSDVLAALRELHIPVLRWPGGCFADEYHWRDGVGPRENRPRMVNSNWGGTVEDNSFGTHEFLNLCEKLGCEPYISGNVGSGTVEELAKWVEYMTAPEGPMALLRAENGRKEPWRVKYLGVGNESWGCGGNMRPEYYSHLYRRYATYCRNFGENRLYKVASGASDYDFNWTEVLMKQIGNRLMDGISLHYYTIRDWNNMGSATQFNDTDYYNTITKALGIEPVLQRHIALMDAYDPEHRVDLLVDEWGTWFDEEPGTIRGHLYQQSTMRDAMVAALTFNIFHRYTKRVKMANIAQIANVLQAMVLTRGSEMVLTPTYHIFRMYRVHQGSEYLPASAVDGNEGTCHDVSITASRNAAQEVNISVVNPDLTTPRKVVIEFDTLVAGTLAAEILHAERINDFNDFGKAVKVAPRQFSEMNIKGNRLEIRMPAQSIVTLKIK